MLDLNLSHPSALGHTASCVPKLLGIPETSFMQAEAADQHLQSHVMHVKSSHIATHTRATRQRPTIHDHMPVSWQKWSAYRELIVLLLDFSVVSLLDEREVWPWCTCICTWPCNQCKRVSWGSMNLLGLCLKVTYIASPNKYIITIYSSHIWALFPWLPSTKLFEGARYWRVLHYG